MSKKKKTFWTLDLKPLALVSSSASSETLDLLPTLFALLFPFTGQKCSHVFDLYIILLHHIFKEPTKNVFKGNSKRLFCLKWSLLSSLEAKTRRRLKDWTLYVCLHNTKPFTFSQEVVREKQYHQRYTLRIRGPSRPWLLFARRLPRRISVSHFEERHLPLGQEKHEGKQRQQQWTRRRWETWNVVVEKKTRGLTWDEDSFLEGKSTSVASNEEKRRWETHVDDDKKRRSKKTTTTEMENEVIF